MFRDESRVTSPLMTVSNPLSVEFRVGLLRHVVQFVVSLALCAYHMPTVSLESEALVRLDQALISLQSQGVM